MSDLDMEQICRLCCTIKCRMRPLYEQWQEYPLSLVHMIYAVAQIQIDPNDGMPQKICSPCVTTLTKMYSTIESYWENDSRLKKQLERTKPDESGDTTELYLNHVVVEEDCRGTESPKARKVTEAKENGTDENQDDDDTRLPIELDICIKDDPLEEYDEVNQVTVTKQNLAVQPILKKKRGPTELPQNVTVEDSKPTAVQEAEPILKKRRARSTSRKVEESRPTELPQNVTVEDSKPTAAVQESEPILKKKRGRRSRKVEESKPTELPQNVTVEDSKPTAAVQEHAEKNEPLAPKRKRGRPHRQGEAPSRPKLYDFKCYICKSESHGSAAALLVHLNSSHEDLLPFTCPECVMETVVLTTLLTLNVHLRRHLNPVKCLYCDRRYLSKCKVAIHVQQYHPSMVDDADRISIKCDQCDEGYSSKVSLARHVKLVHTVASSKVQCAACGEVFNDRTKLRSHIQRQHGVSSKRFECNICRKKLTTLEILQNHLKRYHSDSSRQFECSYCPETFSFKVLKLAHEKGHTPESEPTEGHAELDPVIQRRGGRRMSKKEET